MAWGQQERGAALEKLQVLGCMQGLTQCCVSSALGMPPLVSLQPQLGILTAQIQASC